MPNLSWRHLMMMLRKQWKAALAPLGLLAAIAVTLGTVGSSRTSPTANGNIRAATPSSTAQPTPELTPSASASPSPTVPPTATPGASTSAPRPKPVVRGKIAPRNVPGPLFSGASTIAEEAFGTGQDAYLGDTSRYGYVELNDYEYGYVAGIHSANPATKVIVYAEVQTEGPNSCQYDAHPSWGVSYCYANQYHPEWFLLNASGQRAQYVDNGYYMMDMSSASYQQAWANNEIAMAKRDGFNGVIMDDVNLSPAHGNDGKLQYTDGQYEKTVLSFVAAVAPSLKAAGLIVAANVGAANPWDATAVAESATMAPYLSIYNHEFWMRWQEGTPLFAGSAWLASIQMQEAIQATGTAWTAVTYGSVGDIAAMRYARASFLLAWDGRAGSALMYRPDPDVVNPYHPDWTTDLGTPTGNRYAVGVGWRRQFSAGTVLVNPSASTNQTFALGGAYRIPDGSVVTSATLGPTSALIVRSS